MTDTSTEHIVMVDCEEVQAGWKPQKGDWVAFNRPNHKAVELVLAVNGENKDELATWLDDGEPDYEPKISFLFIPDQRWYQEQIISILSLERQRFVFPEFYEWFNDNYCLTMDATSDISFEQLWCLFFMHTTHGKTWNGKEWISND